MVRMCGITVLVFLMMTLAPAHLFAQAKAPRQIRSDLSLGTPDVRLQECFEWAKGQALAYARTGDPKTRRRAHSEVSYAVIGAIVNGLMGIEPSETGGAVKTVRRVVSK